MYNHIQWKTSKYLGFFQGGQIFFESSSTKKAVIFFWCKTDKRLMGSFHEMSLVSLTVKAESWTQKQNVWEISLEFIPHFSHRDRGGARIRQMASYLKHNIRRLFMHLHFVRSNILVCHGFFEGSSHIRRCVRNLNSFNPFINSKLW